MAPVSHHAAPAPLFVVGDRVRHIDANLTGTVDMVTPEWVRVNWDHLGLAYAQLGQMCDYRKSSELEHVAE